MELLNADIMCKISSGEAGKYKLTKEAILGELAFTIVEYANIGRYYVMYTYPEYMTNDEIDAIILTLKLYKYKVEHYCNSSLLMISWGLS